MKEKQSVETKTHDSKHTNSLTHNIPNPPLVLTLAAFFCKGHLSAFTAK